MLNRAILMGRLTRDPELRQTPNNVSVATFSLAVDRNYQADKNNKQTDKGSPDQGKFFECRADFSCNLFLFKTVC